MNADSAPEYPTIMAELLDSGGLTDAWAEVGAWEDYRPTPLISLDGLARRLGVAALWYKDEGGRFELKSFKALGGAYAVCRILQDELGRRHGRPISSSDLIAGVEGAANFTMTCATDGNHGRSVAWGAKMFGARSVIFVPEAVSQARCDRIERFGAEVIRIAGTYDEAIEHCALIARQRGWYLVADTADDLSAEVPRRVMEGYMIAAAEAAQQIGDQVPTHVFVQAGVGGFAAAVCAHFWERWGDDRPRLIVVEPEKADCLFLAAQAGEPTQVPGDLATLMGGMSCGMASALAWKILRTGANDFVTIDDASAVQAMRMLAEGGEGDLPIVAGESGAAGLAALLAAQNAGGAWAQLGLRDDSRILLFGTEGDTDEVMYQEIVGRSADDVRSIAEAV